MSLFDTSPPGQPEARPDGKRPLAERMYNVVHWTEFERGGHFAALEVPDLFVSDVRAFFNQVQ